MCSKNSVSERKNGGGCPRGKTKAKHTHFRPSCNVAMSVACVFVTVGWCAAPRGRRAVARPSPGEAYSHQQASTHRKITGLCLLRPIGCTGGVQSVPAAEVMGVGRGEVCRRRAGLEGDEVDQVALGRGHTVWEEVDERVEELRPLGVRLVYV